ncbi:MAG: hypothetical protein AB1589_21060 [Cyanobacteriota bacterium]
MEYSKGTAMPFPYQECVFHSIENRYRYFVTERSHTIIQARV